MKFWYYLKHFLLFRWLFGSHNDDAQTADVTPGMSTHDISLLLNNLDDYPSRSEYGYDDHYYTDDYHYDHDDFDMVDYDFFMDD